MQETIREQITSGPAVIIPAAGSSLAAADEPILTTVLRHRKAVLLASVAGTLLTAAVAFLIPPNYTATTVIMPPQQTQSAANAIAGQIGALASIGGREFGLLRMQSDLYIGLLGSRNIADALITRFRLSDSYKTKTQIDTRRKLAARTDIVSGKDTLIKISVTDKNPQRAAEMANAYVEELQKQNDRLAVTEAGQRRLVFERQVKEEKAALIRAEAELKSTQERTGVLQVSGQIEAVIRSVAELRAEITAREVSLRRLQVAATPQNPEVIRSEAELAELRTKLQKLESSSKTQRGNPVIPTAAVPAVGLEYVRALRELKYHETLFDVLSRQYEIARIDEAKEASVIQVVDRALAPDKKSGPPRMLLIALGCLGSALMAGLVVVGRQRFGQESQRAS